MITLKEKVRKDVKNFHMKLARAKNYADKQEMEKKVMLYKKINLIEYDLNDLKRTLDAKITPPEKSRFYLKPDTKLYYEKVINGLKELNEQVGITLWRENPSFIDSIYETYRELKEKFLTTANA